MQLGYGLYQQQTQKLIMTTELRQAITILQYSAIELTEYLHNEIVENPVFDIDEKEFERYDFLYRNYRKAQPVYQSSDDNWSIWDTIATPQATLEEHLLEQARFLSLNKEKLNIIKYLIGCIDDSGYLSVPIDEVTNKFGTDESEIEDVLMILQSFDPIGVGSRDLKELLLIQLKNDEPIDSLAIEIVQNYLKELGEHKFVKIAQKLKVNVQEVQQVFDLLKTLKPKPAMNFQSSSPKYIVPDVIVEVVDGEYVVIVNDTLVPRLRINHHYHQYMQSNKNDETAKYIMDKFSSAKWLIKSIEQRRNTLYKVTSAIMKYQDMFFQNQLLNPLTLKQIAEEVGVHESTVSRAINQKYVQTPLGIFELKYFFSTGLTTSSGDVTSSENVKKTLQELIENENKKKPLSDQKITKLLNEMGIQISRRTVAKYRDELGILSSSSRKRF